MRGLALYFWYWLSRRFDGAQCLDVSEKVLSLPGIEPRLLGRADISLITYYCSDTKQAYTASHLRRLQCCHLPPSKDSCVCDVQTLKETWNAVVSFAFGNWRGLSERVAARGRRQAKKSSNLIGWNRWRRKIETAFTLRDSGCLIDGLLSNFVTVLTWTGDREFVSTFLIKWAEI
jgi:hypothetical protein